jgi:hypothetical protein
MISPSVVINPTTGSAGQEVSITGTGFGAGKRISVSFNGMVLGQLINADSKGSFDSSFVIPVSKGGTHLITAADNTGAVASSTFEIEAVAPANPAPISPVPGEKIGGIVPAVVTFAWTQVEDPSGVSYVLELSRSPDFASIVMRKEGLSLNEYTLNDEEALPNAEYFWHVKAVDGASNESGWSTAQSVRVRGFEMVFIVIAAVIGVLIVAAVIWRIVRLSKTGWK